MCKCTPEIRTPFCGKANCVWPAQKEEIKMTNYVFGKFYKTKCGRKVLYTGFNPVMEEHVFFNENHRGFYEDEIESEWQDEKPKRKVTYYCYEYNDELVWSKFHDLERLYTRIPSLDKIVEVPE